MVDSDGDIQDCPKRRRGTRAQRRIKELRAEVIRLALEGEPKDGQKGGDDSALNLWLKNPRFRG